ncbi:MAG: PilZ domain-containing protein [Acidobacteriota bacterium]
MSERKGEEQERRRSPRVRTSELPGQIGLELETDVLQLSVGGMLVEVSVPLDIGSEHRFTLSIEDEEMALSGVVRNCEPADEGEDEERPSYRIGIEFRDLEARQKELLSRFVEKRLKT